MTDRAPPSQANTMQETFRVFFEEHFDYVYRSLRRLGVQERDLEDVTHDVFLEVHAAWSRFDRTRPPKPWLFAFAFRFASDYRRLARHRNVPTADMDLVNDRPDLALATGCDGVHVGQEDASYEEARRILGLGRIVGVTCHASRDLSIDAAEAGADYVAFGAFFPTGTKDAKHHAEPEIIRWWSEMMTVPCVAIGGITPENCSPLVAAGADFLAVVSSVWNHPGGPAAAVKAFGVAIASSASAIR